MVGNVPSVLIDGNVYVNEKDVDDPGQISKLVLKKVDNVEPDEKNNILFPLPSDKIIDNVDNSVKKDIPENGLSSTISTVFHC